MDKSYFDIMKLSDIYSFP